jgi:hypothetical protein
LCDGINRSLGAFTVSSEKVSEILEKYPSLSLPAPNLRVLSIDVLFVANCLFYRTVGRRAAEKSLQKE